MSSETPTDSHFVVQHPFDDPSLGADLVLRSSDHVDFYASKAVLADASSVFRDMMVVGSPVNIASEHTADETRNGLPLIIMHDCPALCLDTLLRILYPIPTPKLNGLGLSTVLCVAVNAHKYDMCHVFDYVEHALLTTTLDKPGQGPQAMQAYLLAKTFGLNNVALHFARETLRFTVEEAYSLALEDNRSSAADVWRLFAYRKRVEEKIAANAAIIDRSIRRKPRKNPQGAQTVDEAVSAFKSFARKRALASVDECFSCMRYLSMKNTLDKFRLIYYLREAYAKPLSDFKEAEVLFSQKERESFSSDFLDWAKANQKQSTAHEFAEAMKRVVSEVELD